MDKDYRSAFVGLLGEIQNDFTNIENEKIAKVLFKKLDKPWVVSPYANFNNVINETLQEDTESLTSKELYNTLNESILESKEFGF